MQKRIVVFAANDCAPEKEKYYYTQAYETGQLLAKAGFVSVSGGGPGLMNEVMRGAFENGGRTMGICLDIVGRKHSLFLTKKEVFTDLRERQERLISLGDGFIAMPGGIGTIYEITAVLALKRKGELDTRKPFIIIDPVYAGLHIFLKKLEKEGLIPPKLFSYYSLSDTPGKAISALKKYYEI